MGPLKALHAVSMKDSHTGERGQETAIMERMLQEARSQDISIYMSTKKMLFYLIICFLVAVGSVLLALFCRSEFMVEIFGQTQSLFLFVISLLNVLAFSLGSLGWLRRFLAPIPLLIINEEGIQSPRYGGSLKWEEIEEITVGKRSAKSFLAFIVYGTIPPQELPAVPSRQSARWRWGWQPSVRPDTSYYVVITVLTQYLPLPAGQLLEQIQERYRQQIEQNQIIVG